MSGTDPRERRGPGQEGSAETPREGVAEDEGARLDRALLSSFDDVVTSLQVEERSRRRGLAFGLFLAAGVVLLTVVAIVVLRRGGGEDAARHRIARAEELAREGWASFQEGGDRAAEAAFAEVLELDPEQVEGHNGMGWVLLNRGEEAAAKAHFELALELRPRHGGARNGLARCLSAEGRVEEAIAIWEQLDADAEIELHAGVYGLARAWLDRGRCAEAVPYLERIARQRAEERWAHEALERCGAAAAD